MTTNERARKREEDGLKHLLDCEEGAVVASVDSVAGALGLKRPRATDMLAGLASKGLAKPRGDGWALTAEGRREALEVVRKHRLVETWLARKTSVPAEAWHRAAHVAEHQLGTIETDELANRLGNPRFDPHGDPIPTREGVLPPARRISLAEWPEGRDALIEHMEDEPETVFRDMVRAGLHPGMVVSGIARLTDGGMELTGEGRTVKLPPAWLGMVHVTEVDAGEQPDSEVKRLSDLPVGSVSVVQGLSPACVGAERTRLLDLGLVPGTEMRCEFTSPFQWPRAYFIRGTMIALRHEQAGRILVKPKGGAA